LVYADVTGDDLEGAYEASYYSTAYPDYEADRKIHELNNEWLLREIE
jgi:hypothetical protein